jgi:phage shock protein PspC (stress-responsive transcriptional regulator)
MTPGAGLVGGLAGRWNLDPAMLALFAVLHDRKI